MNQLKPPVNGYESRIRASVIRLFQWCAGWGVTSALMSFGPKFLWHKSAVLTGLAIVLDIAVGVGAILANKRFIDELDELQRRVQLNSMAITVGVAIVAGVPLSVMDAYHLIPFHADIAHLMMIMAVTLVVSNVYGTRRYR